LIIDNQLNRRNITDGQRTYLIGKRYKEEKKELGRPIIENKGQTISPLKTAAKIAEQSNISHQTVKNAEKFADAVDKVAKNTGISPQKILSDDVKATQTEIKKVAAFEPEKQKQVFKAVEDKEVKEGKEADIKNGINEVKREDRDKEIKEEQERKIEKKLKIS
jgi:hypothetical protein